MSLYKGNNLIAGNPVIDQTVIPNSSHAVSGGGVKSYVDGNISKRNLLDNAYFVGGGSQQGGGQLPINQRGYTSYPNAGHGIDCWMTRGYTSIGNLESNPDGIVLNFTGEGCFDQYAELGRFKDGETLTFSALTTNGTMNSFTFTASKTTAFQSDVGNTFGLTNGYFRFAWGDYDALNQWKIRIGNASGSESTQIAAAKLERGSIQTLAHQENGVWVLNEIPDYQKELFKCETSTGDPYDVYSNHRNLVEGMARPNENLLRNWYFVGGGSQQGGKQFPINQGGETSYTGFKSFFNGWHGSTYITATINSGNVTFSSSAASGGVSFYQAVDNAEELLGKTVTGTVLTSDGTLYTGTGTMPSTIPSTNTYVFSLNTNVGKFQFQYVVARLDFEFVLTLPGSGRSISLVATKLELGSTQTLARNTGTAANPVWELNDLPDYDYELFKCQTSTADPSDVYANHQNLVEGMARPNENLLDNWYFAGGGTGYGVFPVNQRGQTQFSVGGAKVFDRWAIGAGGGAVELLSAGAKISCGNNQNIYQRLTTRPADLLNKTLTLSFLDTNGNLYKRTGTVPSVLSGGNIISIDVPNFGTAVFAYSTSTALYYVAFLGQTGSQPITVIAAKLEFGSTQTLAHQENGVWVLNEIPRYDDELRRCQAYLNIFDVGVIGSGFMNAATVAICEIPTPVSMRPIAANTNVSFSGTLQVLGGGTVVNATAAKIHSVNKSGVCLTITVPTGISAFQAVSIAVGANSSIVLSAEL